MVTLMYQDHMQISQNVQYLRAYCFDKIHISDGFNISKVVMNLRILKILDKFKDIYIKTLEEYNEELNILITEGIRLTHIRFLRLFRQKCLVFIKI